MWQQRPPQHQWGSMLSLQTAQPHYEQPQLGTHVSLKIWKFMVLGQWYFNKVSQLERCKLQPLILKIHTQGWSCTSSKRFAARSQLQHSHLFIGVAPWTPKLPYTSVTLHTSASSWPAINFVLATAIQVPLSLHPVAKFSFVFMEALIRRSIKSKVPLVTRLPPNLFSDGNSLYFLSVDSLALLGLLVRVSELW
jgi:hypothetical protein